jgi:hypothetical protein
LHRHAVLSSVEVETSGQLRQTEAPSVIEYLPAPQSVHASEPVTCLCFPAEQAVHALPVYPVLHRHAVRSDMEVETPGHAKHTDSNLAASVTENFPSPQSVHAPEPVTCLYFPAEQAVHALPVYPALHWHAVRFDVEVETPGHAKHTDSNIAASVTENFPSPQSVHAPAPETGLYFPAAHAVQDALPVYPTTHRHEVRSTEEDEYKKQLKQTSSTTAATETEYLPEPQSVHAPVPVSDLYFPAKQAVHSLPVYPALHLHEACPIVEVECPGHNRHAVSVVAPTVAEYLPTGHSVHCPVPTNGLYFPATQGVQSPVVCPRSHS